MNFLHAGVSRTASTLCLLAVGAVSITASAQRQPSNQKPSAAAASAAVPHLVSFSGKALDGAGKTITGVASVVFAIYEEQSGGASLWTEAQNMTSDARGNYTVQLGANTPEGLPLELFASGAARWLGVRINGGEEQPRVLLLSVPYALKAADAETVGGLPASAFVLAGSEKGVEGNAASQNAAGTVSPQVGGTGTAGTIPIWTDGSGDLGNSVIFQSGAGGTAKIGINTNTPAAPLDVNGNQILRGNLNLPPVATATATAGSDSRPITFLASSFNSASNTAVTQNFRWQAEPTSNNTATPGGTMSLLYSAGANPIKETGFRIANNGQITFAPGQTFPASTVTGNETVNGNVSATQLISTAPQGTPPLQVSSTTQVPNLNASLLNGHSASDFASIGANAFVGNETISGNVGVGTTTPATTLDVFSATAGIHAPIAKFGSNSTTDSNSILTYNGSGTTEMFQSGCAGCFVPGAQAGDGGIRVSLGKSIFFGDSGTSRLRLDSIGNIDQPRAAGGTVKAMLHFSPFNNGKIISCFNSTLSGAAATTPPCGIFFDITGKGDYIFDFGFEVDDRIYSVNFGTQEIGIVGSACGNQDGQCIHTGTLTNNQVEVIADLGGSGNSFVDTKVHLIIY